MFRLKHIKSIIVICGILNFANAQEAFHNYGNIQIHNTATVGFHLNLINDGTFDQNMGLVGFYKDFGRLTVSGAFTPVFYDAEVAVDNGLVLETSLSVMMTGWSRLI